MMAPGKIPSNNLWVENLAPDVTSTILVSLFQRYGSLDRVIAYSPDGIAFILFKNINDSMEAKMALEGFFFHGMPLKIKFSTLEQIQEYQKMRDEWHPDRRIGRPNHPQLMHQDFVRNYSDPIYPGFTRQHEQGLEFGELREGHYSNRGIVRPNPRFVPPDFVRNDFHPMNVGFTRKHEKEQEFWDGHHPHRSIVHPNPWLMPRDFVRNYSHPMNADFTRQHVMEGKLFNDPRSTIEYSNNENPFQPAQMIGHNRPMLTSNVSACLPPFGPAIPARPLSMQGRFRPMLTSNVSGCLPPFGPDIPARPLSMQGRFRPIQLRDTSPHNVIGDPNWKQASPTPRVEPPSRFASDQGYLLDEQYGLGPFGSDVPSGSVIVSQANKSDARISPGQHHSGHDFIWRGIIAKNGTSVCRAICVPVGESIKCEIPEVVNCYARAGLDRLTKHYADAAVGFSVVSFLPEIETDDASYREFLRNLSINDRAGVAKLVDGTNMFLVPPSNFTRKVLKVDGLACLYGVVFKSAPGGPSWAPESIQRQYPEITPSQFAQAREHLTTELVDSLRKLQQSSSVEGTAGAFNLVMD